jgi:hypothetical protein
MPVIIFLLVVIALELGVLVLIFLMAGKETE